MEAFIRRLYADPQMLRMGHAQRKQDLNLGLGWIYYALARAMCPTTAVVVGSYRGFVPAVLGKALLDNLEGGEVVFVDPSYVDDFWQDPAQVNGHFASLGTSNVSHYRYSTQEFIATERYKTLSNVGLVMIDGYHTAEQARFDYLAFLGKLSDQAVVLFHDSVRARTSMIYGEDKPYEQTVYLLIERLQNTPGLEVFTLPFGQGISLVRGYPATFDLINQPF